MPCGSCTHAFGDGNDTRFNNSDGLAKILTILEHFGIKQLLNDKKLSKKQIRMQKPVHRSDGSAEIEINEREMARRKNEAMQAPSKLKRFKLPLT